MTTHYPKPDLVAETEWLAARLDDPGVVVIDCDDERLRRGRPVIQGAVGLQVSHLLKGPDRVHVMGAEEFERLMSAHGIGNGSLVVAYDSEGGGRFAARLWWALDYYGHGDCRVLNGGFKKWAAEGRPVAERPRTPEPAVFRARPRPQVCATLEDMREAVGRDDVLVWDVRSSEERAGEDVRSERGGRMPGSVHLEWLALTEPPDFSGRLLPAEEIGRKLKAAGITGDKRVYTHCQSGIRAAYAAYALRVMGYEGVRNYDGSWDEWGNREDTPIEG